MDQATCADLEKLSLMWKGTETGEAADSVLLTMEQYSRQFLERLYDSKPTEGNRLEDTGLSLDDVLKIGKDKLSFSQVVQVYDKDVVRAQGVLDFSKSTFMSLIPGSGHLLYSAGDFIASITHVSSMARFVNSRACDIDAALVKWVLEIVGYPDEAEGVLVSGTSMGAVIAFATARDDKLPDSDLYKRAVVYMTEQAHLCNGRGLRVTGLGNCVHRAVPSYKHRMDPDQLEALILQDKEAGLIPFLVITTMGSTGVGAVDPLGPINAVADRHNVWHHVDASYGGFLLLDDQINQRFRGISGSHSITLDFHKGISASFGTAALVVRDGRHLKSAMARGSAPYLANADDSSEYSPLEVSFEFARPFRSFPIWSTLKVLGTDVVKRQMTEKVLLARYAFEELSKMPNIAVYQEPDLTLIVFRFNTADNHLSNRATKKWLELLHEDGAICLNSTVVEELFYIRMCILSFRTHIESIRTALDSIRKTMGRLQSDPILGKSAV